jgi:CHAD domain-containing protein
MGADMFDWLMRPLRPLQPIPSPGAVPFQNRTLSQWKALQKVLPGLHPKCSRGKIHEARVLSRRFRASFSVLQKIPGAPRFKKLRKAVRGLTRLLGPIRSLDVTTDLWGEQLKKMADGKTKKLGFIAESLQEKRKKLRKRLQGLPKNPFEKKNPLKIFETSLKKIPWQNFSDRFHQRFSKSSEKLLVDWRRFAAKRSLKNLHQLRIGLKKWRYLTEIRSECFSPLPKSFFDRVKDLQDSLGTVHDLDVLKIELSAPGLQKKAIQRRSAQALNAAIRELDREIARGTENFFFRGKSELEALVTARNH